LNSFNLKYISFFLHTAIIKKNNETNIFFVFCSYRSSNWKQRKAIDKEHFSLVIGRTLSLF